MKKSLSNYNLAAASSTIALAILFASTQVHAQVALSPDPSGVPTGASVPINPVLPGVPSTGTMPIVQGAMAVLPDPKGFGVGFLPVDPITGQFVLPPQPVYAPGSLDAALAPDLNAPGASTNYAAALSISARGVVRPPPLDPVLMARLPVAPGTQPPRREAPTAPLPVNPANGLPPPFPPMGSLQPITPNGLALPLQ